jgi:hypothetical protein
VHRGRCKPESAGINFSRLLVPLVDETLALPALDLVPRLVRENAAPLPIVSEVWELLQAPVEFEALDMWLVYRPTGVFASPVAATDGALVTEVAYRVLPRLFVGDRPSVERVPLPETKVRLYGSTLEVAFDCGITFGSIEEGIVEFCQSSAPGLKIENAKVSGGGDRIVVTITLAGQLEGTVYLTGTMQYDAATSLFAPRDFVYSDESIIALRDAWDADGVTNADSLLEKLLACVQTSCSADIHSAVDAYLSQLGHAHNYSITDDFAIRGGIRERKTAGVFATERIFGVRQIAIGHATISQSP